MRTSQLVHEEKEPFDAEAQGYTVANSRKAGKAFWDTKQRDCHLPGRGRTLIASESLC